MGKKILIRTNSKVDKAGRIQITNTLLKPLVGQEVRVTVRVLQAGEKNGNN